MNFKLKISSFGVLDCSFCDHSLIYGIRGSPSKLSLSPVVKAIQCFRNYSKITFCSELRILDWSSVYLAPNVDVALENFNSLLLSVINRVAPVRKMRFKKDSQP